MSEQLFLKQYSQLPESLKQELLEFLEFLMFKHQKQQTGKQQKQALPNNKKITNPEKKSSQKDLSDKSPCTNKHLPIERFKRSRTPVPLEFGGSKHLVKYMADDFTAPIEDSENFMA